MKKLRWKNCDKREKASRVVGYTLLALMLLATVFVIFGRFITQVTDTRFYDCIDIFTKAKKFNPYLRSLSYVICVLSLSYVVRKIMSTTFHWLRRGLSVISLLCSFIKYIAAIVMIFLILATFGVDTDALIAGLGILSLVVGLAIQPLLQDIIAGLFVVFEKTYDVGDVVVVDSFRGTVVEIGIRTTKLQDAGGDIKVINNSDIRTLVNMTSELSMAICEVDIEYGESLERVEKVIEENLSLMKEKIPSIIDGPYYKGVVQLGVNGVTLRLVAQCAEGDKFQAQRDMNRQIKLIFDANGIGIPFAQMVVHQAKEKTPQQGVGSTEEFVLRQNALSKNLGDEEEK